MAPISGLRAPLLAITAIAAANTGIAENRTLDVGNTGEIFEYPPIFKNFTLPKPEFGFFDARHNMDGCYESLLHLIDYDCSFNAINHFAEKPRLQDSQDGDNPSGMAYCAVFTAFISLALASSSQRGQN